MVTVVNHHSSTNQILIKINVLVEPEAPGDAEANIAIRIRRGIIQIERERPGIAAIVPITTTDEAVRSQACIAHAYHRAKAFLPLALFSSNGLIALSSPLALAKLA